MRQVAESWAVVLAGGDGSRLSTITKNPEGLIVPKQYCSLGRSTCLLQDALMRARSVSLPSHVCAVVAAQHQRWWNSAVLELDESNIFVQPCNKGTGRGILLALLTLEMRNPAATIALLPADHYFRDEGTVSRALRVAGNLACANPGSTYLMGAQPASADPELGYILPAARVLDTPTRIAGFKEKPNPDHAEELVALGALWNLFILVGSISGLLALFSEDHADAVLQMREALKEQAAGHRDAVARLYEKIQPIDFSRDVLETQADRLQVIRVPRCGWTDLGTPTRVEATLRSIGVRANSARIRKAQGTPLFFDLSAHSS
jgi:mannose-1-phosphate guanylyltransferase